MLETLAVLAQEELGNIKPGNDKERTIFKTQFVLNYLSRQPTQKFSYISQQFSAIANYQTFIDEKLMKVLQERCDGSKSQRTTSFIKKEAQHLLDLTNNVNAEQ